MGLFIGPLFTIYKAHGDPRRPRLSASRDGRRAVFWLQNEDTTCPRSRLPTFRARRGPLAAARTARRPPTSVSVAHRLLPDDVTTCLATWASSSPICRTLRRISPARAALHPRRSWSDAFAACVRRAVRRPRAPDPSRSMPSPPRRHRCTGGDVDAKPIAPIPSSHGAVSSRTPVRADASMSVPVQPLSFFPSRWPQGPRYRLTPADDGYRALVVHDGRYRATSLLSASSARPADSAEARCSGRHSRTRCCRPRHTSAARPRSRILRSWHRSTTSRQTTIAMPLIVPARPDCVSSMDERHACSRGWDCPRGRCRADAERLAAARHRPTRTRPALDRRVRAPFAEALEAVRADMEPLPPVWTSRVRKKQRAAGRGGARHTSASTRSSWPVCMRARNRHRCSPRARHAVAARAVPQERLYGLAILRRATASVPFSSACSTRGTLRCARGDLVLQTRPLS